jgi:hypothetical protein
MLVGIGKCWLVWTLLIGLALTIAGCSGSSAGSKSAQLDAHAVRARSDMYSLYLATHKYQPPKDEAEFRQFLSSEQSRLEEAGLTVDQMFTSPRSGAPMTWVFAKRPPTVGGISVYAYESNAVDGQRLILGDRGMSVIIDDAQFKTQFPDAH